MKRNVDLTENMMFSQTSNHFQFEKSNEQPFQKNTTTVLESATMIVLGSAEDRKKKRIIEKIVSDMFCDRCGKEIQSFPGNHLKGLCFQCQNQLDQQLNDRCPWRKKRVY